MSWEAIFAAIGLALTVVLFALGWLIKGLRDNSADQKKAFLQQGEWRAKADVRFAILEERLSTTADRVARIPTGTSPGYRRPKANE